MAIRTQIRLDQLTGSLNDGGALIGPAIPFAATSLQGSLDKTATAIKNITGHSSFSNAVAGTFYQDIKPDGDGTRDLGTSAAEWAEAHVQSVKSTTTLDVDSTGKLSLDGAGGIDIGVAAAVALDVNASTFDLDATGALTIDSATSIAIGATADKPIDIDSTTLDIDASGAVTIDVAGAGYALAANAASSVITSGGALTLTSAAAATWSTGAGALTITSAAACTWSTSAGALTLTGQGTGAGTGVIVTSDLQVNGTNIWAGADEAKGIFTDVTTAGNSIVIGGGGLVDCAGDLKVSGNDIQSGTGQVCISFAGTEVKIPGDLTVLGTTTSIDTTSLEVEDRIVALGFTSGSAPVGAIADSGLLFAGAREAGQKALYYDQGDNRMWAATTFAMPLSASIARTGAIDFGLKNLYLSSTFGQGDGGRVYNAAGNQALAFGATTADAEFSQGVKILDDKNLTFGTNNDVTVKYNESSGDKFQIVATVGEGMDISVPASKTIGLAVNAQPRLIVLDSGIQIGGAAESKIEASTGLDLLVQGVSSQDVRLDSEGELKFVDGNKAGGWSDAEGIKLSTNAASWTNFEAQYGEVSLLDAITAAANSNVITGSKSVYELTGGMVSGLVVPLAADFSKFSAPGEIAEQVDLFVNGQMMVSASEVGGNGDYAFQLGYGASVGATFQFDLLDEDIVQVVVR
jgi:hypothetical protein